MKQNPLLWRRGPKKGIDRPYSLEDESLYPLYVEPAD